MDVAPKRNGRGIAAEAGGSVKRFRPKCAHGVAEIGDEDMDAARFARVRLGFEPDELEAEILRSGAKRGF